MKESQRAILAAAKESFERNLMPTHVGQLDDDTLSVCLKCYCLGYLNGGDHVMAQVEAVQYS